MFDIGVGAPSARAQVVAVPVCADAGTEKSSGTEKSAGGDHGSALPKLIHDELDLYLSDLTKPGMAGTVNVLPRPGRQPGHLVAVGIGAGDEAGWRSAGAALVRAALRRFATLTLHLPDDPTGAVTAARGFAEGAWLASYRYRLGAESPSIKPVEAMRLMRKDMGGAAAVCAAVLGAADLGLPVRLTALAPLAENMISGASFRPGDVIRHYGGVTTEVLNTDAEGRLVLADALAYAARRLKPDVLIDLATLTGASHVALGKRTAAVFSQDAELAAAMTDAGACVGELMWPMPLADAYQGLLGSEIADLNNAPPGGEAGAVTAALFLREFTAGLRDRWVHIDMSAPSWIETPEGPLVKGATGWGVRMLLRWLATL